MTKNERSLQWVIAGIFFVVCFAFFQWIYPNHLFFKEQMRIFLYTTDYFGSPDKPGGLSIQLCKSEKKEFYIRYSS